MLRGAVSKRQTAVSHSTTEAEMISAELGFHPEGLPQMQLWDTIRQRSVQLDFAEDNEAIIKMCRSGHMATMRHVSRTHRVNLASISERFQQDPYITLLPTGTDDQAADLYTKRRMDPRKWFQLLYLNNLIDPFTFCQSPSLDDALRSMFARFHIIVAKSVPVLPVQKSQHRSHLPRLPLPALHSIDSYSQLHPSRNQSFAPVIGSSLSTVRPLTPLWEAGTLFLQALFLSVFARSPLMRPLLRILVGLMLLFVRFLILTFYSGLPFRVQAVAHGNSITKPSTRRLRAMKVLPA